ncbi:MAG: hypothetical protein Sv326_0736 [Candidatus Fermentimicrarchaeum limneticum]|uniref:Thioredoxin-like fold domain-containing protein n=1 Tax=Fermentimicrarchaeum limneticum TaxID=2795018 RepID=A0A7D5XCW7_FERL1|nr:MAG: hypothetical protein Sv326_0736 [Candidatus Fermentimicrarchaeum limneticum]
MRKDAKNANTKTCYIIILIAVAAFAAISYLIFARSTCQRCECPVQNCTASTPKQNLSNVKSFMGRVMDSYSDLAFADPVTPSFIPQEGVWESAVLLNRSGSTKTVRIRVYDSNLTLESVLVEGPKPPSLSSDEVVANGIVKMSGRINCSEDKIRLFVFFDLYCPPCIADEKIIDEARQKFNQSVNFDYKIIMTHSYDLANTYDLENVSRAAGYLLCSRAQGKLDEFKQCAVEAYMKHEEVPLNMTELNDCANSTSLNATALDGCMGSYYLDLNKDRMLAESYGLVGFTQTVPSGAPVVTVDCLYKAQADYVEKLICYAHPELEECK